MHESLVKYLAGLLDADGSLSFAFKVDPNTRDRCYLSLILSLASSIAVDQHKFVDSLPVLTGMGSVNYYGARQQFKSWKVFRRAELEMLLPRLIKHMVIKAKHWQWLLDTWRTIRAERGSVSTSEREQLTQASKDSRRLLCGPLKPKNHPTWAWTAGYLDGDGTYAYFQGGVTQQGYQQWHMHVAAVAHINDICVLHFLQKAFGGHLHPQGQAENVLIWRRSLGYQNRDFALKFLPNLAKHARFKRAKIEAMIHHHRQRLSVPGSERHYCACGLPARGHGLCSKHYQRWRRSGQATV
jgi:hypothetical protein